MVFLRYFLLSIFLLTQGDYTLVKKIIVETKMMLTDHLGNLYALTNSRIIKYDNNGNELTQYSNAYLGEITHADVSDPFRILLFYKDFNQVQLLDKNFAEIASPVSLDDLDISQVEIACTSNRGGFWVYDSQTTQLKYINRALNVNIETLPVNSVVEIVQQPNFLIEKNDFLYLNLPEVGILIFDKFGSYYKKVSLFNLMSFQIKDGDIVFFENKSLYRYNHELMKTESIVLPDTMGVLNARIERENIYIQKSNRLMIYLKKEE